MSKIFNLSSRFYSSSFNLNQINKVEKTFTKSGLLNSYAHPLIKSPSVHLVFKRFYLSKDVKSKDVKSKDVKSKVVKKPFSRLTKKDFQKEFGFTVEIAFKSSRRSIGEMIPPLHTVPDELKTSLFQRFKVLEKLEGGFYDYVKEAVIHDYVQYLLIPILDYGTEISKCEFNLDREKSIVSIDSTKGHFEFVIMKDTIYKLFGSIKKMDSNSIENYLVIIEVKKADPNDAFVQCMFALKSVFESSAKKSKVYGLITNFGSWRLIVYEGSHFEMSRSFRFFFEDIKLDYWLKEHSMLIDYIYSILVRSK